MRVVVTGGAGFLGSHLCRLLLSVDHEVVCIDNLSTGRRSNVDSLFGDRRFEFHQADVAAAPLPVRGRVDAVAHLASPASPPDYHRMPLETLAVGSRGTEHALQLAARHDARFLLASTSEVYGDPLVHPQPEGYQGNVNPIGIRGVYDEAKRYAESITMAYHRHHGVDTRIVRIFNTYGPRMRPDDGRMIPNFIRQALSGEPLTVYGDGTQTRSVQYVDDLVEGVFRLMQSTETRPVNVGNPTEFTVREIAELVIEISGGESELVHEPLPEDDPKQRCPDITRARKVLGWVPRVGAREGLEKTLEWFAERSEGRQRTPLGR